MLRRQRHLLKCVCSWMVFLLDWLIIGKHFRALNQTWLICFWNFSNSMIAQCTSTLRFSIFCYWFRYHRAFELSDVIINGCFPIWDWNVYGGRFEYQVPASDRTYRCEYRFSQSGQVPRGLIYRIRDKNWVTLMWLLLLLRFDYINRMESKCYLAV